MTEEKNIEPNKPQPTIVPEFEVRGRFDNSPSFVLKRISPGEIFVMKLAAPNRPISDLEYLTFRDGSGREFRIFLRYTPRLVESSGDKKDIPNT